MMKKKIEQPHSITGRRWFFRKGWTHSGAEYGQTFDKRTVVRRLARKAGPGSLVKIKGVWYWVTTSPAQTSPAAS